MGKAIIDVKCHGCHRTFQKLLAEYNRRHKMGKNQFCSTQCANRWNHNQIDWKELHSSKIVKDSTFRYILKYVSRRRHPCNVDLPYLKRLWEIQNGICPYTGIKMTFPTHWKEMTRTHCLEKVSLDRIDSTKGYIKGNVEFVCMGVNYAKNKWSKEAAVKFFDAIRNNHPTI